MDNLVKTTCPLGMLGSDDSARACSRKHVGALLFTTTVLSTANYKIMGVSAKLLMCVHFQQVSPSFHSPAGAYAGARAGPGPGAGAVAGVDRVEVRVGS